MSGSNSVPRWHKNLQEMNQLLSEGININMDVSTPKLISLNFEAMNFLNLKKNPLTTNVLIT